MAGTSTPNARRLPAVEGGARQVPDARLACVNGTGGVTWIHSYVSEDKKKTFCIYDGPNPDSIRKAAQRTKLPVDKITEVRVLDPYFFRVD